MTLLAPAALFGLLLLALPIVVHLFKPRKMRRTPFSSLRWLKQTHQRLSRRIRWHQWLLFLMRAGVITCLVLALARPLLHVGGEGRPTDRVVVVDLGRSMAYQEGQEPTPLARAQALAADVIQSARPVDRTAVLLVGARPQVITPLVADATPFVPTLKAAQAGPAESCLSGALPVVRSLLVGEAARETELVLLTDNRPQGWQQGDVQAFRQGLPRPVRVQVIDVGPASCKNGWIADARLLRAGPAGNHVLRVQVGGVGEGTPDRRLHLAGVAGLADDAQAVTIRSGERTWVEFKIPADVPLTGQTAEIRLEPADALPDDDRYFVRLDPAGALQVLLVEPEAPGRDGRPAGLYVRAGLEALSAAGRYEVEVIGRTAANVSAGDVGLADLVVLAGVPELPDAVVEPLGNRVRAGMGLVVFLGDGLKVPFYNERLFNPLQPTEGLLPAPLMPGPDGLTQLGKPGLLTNVRWSHPLLAPLYDPVDNDLTRSRFQRYAAFGAPPGKDDTVLARFDDETPALIDHPLGAGRVLLMNTSATDDWSDLPRRKSYVPLLDRMLGYLSAASGKRNIALGSGVTLPLPADRASGDVAVIAPGGKKLTPRLIHVAGRTLAHLDDTTEAGIYRVEQGGKEVGSFVTNVDRGASRLAAMDGTVLRAWWSPVPLDVIPAKDAGPRFGPAGGGGALWATLAFLAGLLLLAETIYVAILCPRVNPAVVGSVIHQGGILRPLADRATTTATPD